MELWLVLCALSALSLIAVVFLGIQHLSRSRESFIPIEAQALNDVTQGIANLPGGGAGGIPQEVITTPLRYRYVIDGKERLGHLGNPWGLPSVPHILQGNTIRAYFSPSRDEAFLNCRTTLFRLRLPIWSCIINLALGLLLLWW